MQAARKYVVYRTPAGDEAIATFPLSTIHAAYVERARIPRANLVAAGFVSMEHECFGHSSSLRIESRPALDTALLRRGVSPPRPFS